MMTQCPRLLAGVLSTFPGWGGRESLQYIPMDWVKLKCPLPSSPASPELAGTRGEQMGSTLGSPSAHQQGKVLVGRGGGKDFSQPPARAQDFCQKHIHTHLHPHLLCKPLVWYSLADTMSPSCPHHPWAIQREPQTEPPSQMWKTKVSNNQPLLSCLGPSAVPAAPWEDRDSLDPCPPCCWLTNARRGQPCSFSYPHCGAKSCHPRTLLREPQPTVPSHRPLPTNAPWSSVGLVLISNGLSAP